MQDIAHRHASQPSPIDATPGLPSQRALFDMPREICYLNAASWSPLPLATQEAGRNAVARKARPSVSW